MSDQAQPTASGRDLARQALAAYKAGRTPGQTTGPTPKKPRRVRQDRTGGRDPIGFGDVLARIGNEQDWNNRLRGGSILDQWDILCPQFVGHVQAVAFDAERGCLDLRPGSHAYATQLRLLGTQLRKQINDKLGTITVRSLRVLPVGAVTEPSPATDAQPQLSRRDNSADAPVRTRNTASPGYRRALETALAHKPDRTRHLSPIRAAAIDRQNQALTEHREPESAFTDAIAEQERIEKQADRQQPADPLKASVQAALQYKHSGGSLPPVRRLFEAS